MTMNESTFGKGPDILKCFHRGCGIVVAAIMCITFLKVFTVLGLYITYAHIHIKCSVFCTMYTYLTPSGIRWVSYHAQCCYIIQIPKSLAISFCMDEKKVCVALGQLLILF